MVGGRALSRILRQGRTDPFVAVFTKSSNSTAWNFIGRSEITHDDHNPEWRKVFCLPRELLDDPRLFVRLDVYGGDDGKHRQEESGVPDSDKKMIGTATVPVERLITIIASHRDRSYKDYDSGGRKNGRLPREWEQPLIHDREPVLDRLLREQDSAVWLRPLLSPYSTEAARINRVDLTVGCRNLSRSKEYLAAVYYKTSPRDKFRFVGRTEIGAPGANPSFVCKVSIDGNRLDFDLDEHSYRKEGAKMRICVYEGDPLVHDQAFSPLPSAQHMVGYADFTARQLVETSGRKIKKRLCHEDSTRNETLLVHKTALWVVPQVDTHHDRYRSHYNRRYDRLYDDDHSADSYPGGWSDEDSPYSPALDGEEIWRDGRRRRSLRPRRDSVDEPQYPEHYGRMVGAVNDEEYDSVELNFSLRNMTDGIGKTEKASFVLFVKDPMTKKYLYVARRLVRDGASKKPLVLEYKDDLEVKVGLYERAGDFAEASDDDVHLSAKLLRGVAVFRLSDLLDSAPRGGSSLKLTASVSHPNDSRRNKRLSSARTTLIVHGKTNIGRGSRRHSTSALNRSLGGHLCAKLLKSPLKLLLRRLQKWWPMLLMTGTMPSIGQERVWETTSTTDLMKTTV